MSVSSECIFVFSIRKLKLSVCITAKLIAIRQIMTYWIILMKDI